MLSMRRNLWRIADELISNRTEVPAMLSRAIGSFRLSIVFIIKRFVNNEQK